MGRPLPQFVFLALGAALFCPGVAASLGAQEPQPRDTLAPADTLAPDRSPADTLAVAFPQVGNDPRLTWLGDTLGAADTVKPKFSDLPEVWPDSLIHIYEVERPGRWAAWRIPGTALVGRGAYSLLDVLESEFPILAQDLGGSGLATFMGSDHGTGTNVEIVIDGMPGGTPFTAAWDLRQIPLEAIAEVAWHPGPQAAAWGGDGTGGVLAITTKRSLAPGARSMIAFLYGSTDAQGFSGSLGRSITRWGDVFVGANFDAIEGLAGSGDFTRNQSFVRLGWRFGRRHRIEISRRGDGLSGRESRPALQPDDLSITGEEDHNTAAAHLFYTGGLGPLTARIHAQRETHDIGAAFRFGGVDAIVGKGEKEDIRGDLEARIGSRIVVWAGGARVKEDAESEAPVFLSDTINLLDPPAGDAGALRIVPRETTEIAGGLGVGAPADRFAANAAVRRLGYENGPEGEVAWQVEALARPGGGLTLRAAAGSAVRLPDFVGQAILARLAANGAEIHLGFLADPHVLERWTEWRGEVSWAGEAMGLAARAWRATGEGAFLWLPPTAWTRFDPTAEEFPIGEPVGFNAFDVVDLTATGIELDARFPLPYGLEGVVRARALDETLDDNGEQVPYVPDVQFLGQLRYAERFFPSRDMLVEARLSGRFLGERTTLPGETLPATLVGDFLAQVTIVHVTVFVSLKNFADQEIRTEEGFDLPGYEGFLGINWRFRD